MSDSSSRATEEDYLRSVVTYLKTLPTGEVTVAPRLANADGRSIRLDALIEYKLPPDIRIAVGVEVKDSAAALGVEQVAAVKARFAAVGVDLGLLFCTNGVTSAAQTFLESSPPKVTVIVKSLVGVVTSAWSPDFLEALPMLTEAKADPQPSSDLADRVCAAVEHVQHYSRFFFHELTNRAWLKVFTERGVLKRALRRQNEIPILVAAQLPVRFVAAEPDAFLDFASALSGSFQWLETDLTTAAARLPKEARRKFMEIALNWSFEGLIDTEGISKLIELGASEGLHDLVLALHESAVRLWVAASGTGRIAPSSNDLRSNVGHYWFVGLTTLLYPKLLKYGPERIIGYARQRLRKASDLAYPEDSTELPTWRVGHISEDAGPSQNYFLISVAAYRELLVAGIEHSQEVVLNEIVDALRTRVYAVEARVALSVLAARFLSLPEAMATVLEQDGLWGDYQYLPELTDLVERNWTAFDDFTRGAVLERVLNLRPFDFPEQVGHEEVEQHRKEVVVDWLLRIKRSGGFPEDSRETAEFALARDSAVTGITEPSEWSYQRIRRIDHFVEEASLFGELSASDVLDSVRAFVPGGGLLAERTPEEMASKLREQVSSRPSDFVNVGWTQLPYASYASALLDGLVDSMQSGQLSFDVTLASSRALETLESKFPQARDIYDYGSADWVLMSVARFVEASARVLPLDTQLIILDSLTAVSELAWSRITLPVSESVVRDWFTASLNDVGGTLAIGWCRLALLARRIETNDKVSAELRMEAADRYGRLRDVIDREIIGSPRNSIRAPLGFFFTAFYMVDKNWAESRSDNIFDRSDVLRWEAPWSAHFYTTQRYRSVFKHLIPNYLYAFATFTTDENVPGWMEQVGDDIAIFWMDQFLSKSDEVWLAFWSGTREKARRSGTLWILSRFADDSAIETWPLAKEWWETAYAASEGRRVGTHLDAYLHWLERLPGSVSLGEVRLPLIASVEAESRFVPEELYMFLSARVEAEPSACAQILRMVSANEGLYLTSSSLESMRNLLSKSYELGDDEAKETVRDALRTLLKRGAYDLQDLVSEMSG